MKRYRIPSLENTLFNKFEFVEFWISENEIQVLLSGYQKRDENDKFIMNNCWENLLTFEFLERFKNLMNAKVLELKPAFYTCCGPLYTSDDIKYGLCIIIVLKEFETIRDLDIEEL